MELIICDEHMKALRAVEDYSLDIAYGEDENSLKLEIDPDIAPPLDGFVYVDGTAYGGTIDSIKSKVERGVTTSYVLSGRSWQGVLDTKIIMPPTDATNKTYNMSASAFLSSIITDCALSDIFEVGECTGSVNGDVERFCSAYEAIRSLFDSQGLALTMAPHNNKIALGARSALTFSDCDSDLIDFDISKYGQCVNHLICAGKGEGEARVIVHLYADTSGNISETQSLTGIHEIAEYYNYTSADVTVLKRYGTKRLKEYQKAGEVTLSVPEDINLEVGDTIYARDNNTQNIISARVHKKIIKVDRGYATYEYKC